jgi:Tfp pilus assembly protein PilX
MNKTPSSQRGFTLIVALIMLMLMTAIAITTFNIGNSSLQVVSNMQQRDQAQAAAQEALDKLISGTLFTTAPGSVFASNGCPDGVIVGNGLCVDINGDGKTLITVVLSPQPACVQARLVKSATLDLSNPYDAGCVVGQSQSFGIEGSAGSGDSLCADTLWDVQAVATEPTSSAQVTLTEGIAVRAPGDSVAAFCP